MNANAENKHKIISNLQSIKNFDFKFEQNVNGKIENIDFLDWIKKEYNAEILHSSFRSRVEWKRTAIDLMEFSNAKNKC